MERRLLIGLAALLGLLIIAGAIWLIFDAPERPPQEELPVQEDPFGGVREVVGERVGDRLPSELVSPGASGSLAQSKLLALHDKGVAGSVIFVRGGKTYVRFMESESGHVYESDLEGGEKRRISNTTIPGVARAQFSESGGSVAFRFYEADRLRAAVATLSSSTSTSAGFSSVSFLPDELVAFSIAPSGREVFYLIQGVGGSEGYVMSMAGGARRKVFASPFRSWGISWRAENALILSLKPGEGGGLVVRVNPQSGASSVVGAGSSFGGAVASSNGSVLAAVAMAGDSFLSLVRAQDGELGDSSFFDLIPEKCSFVATSTDTMLCAMSSGETPSPSSVLSSWYAGFTVDSNELWFLDLSRGTRALALGTEDMGDLRFDMIEVMSDGAGRFSIFTDRQSRTLWAVRQ